MNTQRSIAASVVLVLALVGGIGSVIAASKDPATNHGETAVVNWQPDGTYLLRTDNPRSIQTYYRDVGVGPLILPTGDEAEAMRETCLSLGEAWRPLGRVLIPDSKGGEPFPLELCYYAAPNPEWVAEVKCANLGLALQENRALRREIVCTRVLASS